MLIKTIITHGIKVDPDSLLKKLILLLQFWRFSVIIPGSESVQNAGSEKISSEEIEQISKFDKNLALG